MSADFIMFTIVVVCLVDVICAIIFAQMIIKQRDKISKLQQLTDVNIDELNQYKLLIHDNSIMIKSLEELREQDLIDLNDQIYDVNGQEVEMFDSRLDDIDHSIDEFDERIQRIEDLIEDLNITNDNDCRCNDNCCENVTNNEDMIKILDSIILKLAIINNKLDVMMIDFADEE